MVQKPDYRYTAVPTQLMLCLDNNCRSVLFTLIQLSTYFQSTNNDFDGWFFRPNVDLEAQTRLSRKVLDGALDALYQAKIIEIIPQQKGQGVKQETRNYKVNFDAFVKYESLLIEDCYKNPELLIKTADYKQQTPSFNKTSTPTTTPTSTLTSTLTSTPTSGKSTNNISIIDKKDNINNINKDKLLNNSNLLINNDSLFLNKNREMVDMNESEYHNTISMVREILKRQRNGEEPSYLKASNTIAGGLEDNKKEDISKPVDVKPTQPNYEDHIQPENDGRDYASDEEDFNFEDIDDDGVEDYTFNQDEYEAAADFDSEECNRINISNLELDEPTHPEECDIIHPTVRYELSNPLEQKRSSAPPQTDSLVAQHERILCDVLKKLVDQKKSGSMEEKDLEHAARLYYTVFRTRDYEDAYNDVLEYVEKLSSGYYDNLNTA